MDLRNLDGYDYRVTRYSNEASPITIAQHDPLRVYLAFSGDFNRGGIDWKFGVDSTMGHYLTTADIGEVWELWRSTHGRLVTAQWYGTDDGFAGSITVIELTGVSPCDRTIEEAANVLRGLSDRASEA